MISCFRNVIVLITLIFLAASPAVAGEIRWQTGMAQLPTVASDQIAGKLTELAARTTAHHLVVQFDRPLTPSQKQALEASGLNLLSYLGNNAFFASVTPNKFNAQAVAGASSITSVAAIQQSWKLHPFLNAGNLPTWAVVAPPDKVRGDSQDLMVAVYVLFHRDVTPGSSALRLAEEHGARVRGLLRSVNALVLEIPFNNIPALAAEDNVQWVEPALPKMEVNNDDNRARTGADTVQAAPYSLDGSGVTVLVYDGGTAYAAHQDFGGRVHERDSSGEHYHSTHVAGTIGGSGAQSGGQYKGMAPAVTIESYGLEQVGGLHQGFLYTDPCDMEADYSQAINTYGADIANNSIGSNTAPKRIRLRLRLAGRLRRDRRRSSTRSFAATAAILCSRRRSASFGPAGNERNPGPRCSVEGFGEYSQHRAPPGGAKNHITVGCRKLEC